MTYFENSVFFLLPMEFSYPNCTSQRQLIKFFCIFQQFSMQIKHIVKHTIHAFCILTFSPLKIGLRDHSISLYSFLWLHIISLYGCAVIYFTISLSIEIQVLGFCFYKQHHSAMTYQTWNERRWEEFTLRDSALILTQFRISCT